MEKITYKGQIIFVYGMIKEDGGNVNFSINSITDEEGKGLIYTQNELRDIECLVMEWILIDNRGQG